MSRLDDLATLADYPSDGCLTRMAEIRSRADGAAVRRFLDRVANLDSGELEELYTKTFDLNPDCALDLGWHLFGEAYGRGAFLVEVKTLLSEHGVEAGTELPDHLPSVLRLLARLDPPRRERLARERVLPALDPLEKGLSAFDSPFVDLVHAVRAELAPAPATTEA